MCVCVFFLLLLCSLLPVGPQSFKRGRKKGHTHTHTHIGRNCRRKKKEKGRLICRAQRQCQYEHNVLDLTRKSKVQNDFLTKILYSILEINAC